MFYIDDMVRQHAFGMKHLQLAVALIDEDHVTRLTYNGASGIRKCRPLCMKLVL